MRIATPRINTIFLLLATALAAVLIVAACGEDSASTPSSPTDTPDEGSSAALSGIVKVDGSSTVFPITEAVAEEFQKVHKDVRVTVGISGTGGGFKKFCLGETDISDASRPVKQTELDLCSENDIQMVEIPVAFDGLSVMVNPNNNFVDYLTVEDLKRIWEPGSTVDKWSDVRSEWPDEEINLVGADTDSGTFDYFTDAIVGEEGASRADYIASADDNVLVTAIADSEVALGYFGFAYYVENPDKLKLVPIDPGDGNAVAPSPETINNGSYQPLSRPLFIYVNVASINKPEIKAFVDFYLSPQQGIPLVSEVGYVPLPEAAYQLVRGRFANKVVGSVFSGGSQPGLTIEDILSQKST